MRGGGASDSWSHRLLAVRAVAGVGVGGDGRGGQEAQEAQQREGAAGRKHHVVVSVQVRSRGELSGIQEGERRRGEESLSSGRTSFLRGEVTWNEALGSWTPGVVYPPLPLR